MSGKQEIKIDEQAENDRQSKMIFKKRNCQAVSSVKYKINVNHESRKQW